MQEEEEIEEEELLYGDDICMVYIIIISIRRIQTTFIKKEHIILRIEYIKIRTCMLYKIQRP